MLSKDNGKTIWSWLRFVLESPTCHASQGRIMEWNMGRHDIENTHMQYDKCTDSIIGVTTKPRSVQI